MTRATLALVALAATTAHAQPTAPGWDDAPAMIAAAVAPVEADLRACVARLPRTISLDVARDRDGQTRIAMPVLGVGYRGFTPEERCLMATVARVTVPALPPSLERVTFAHVVDAATAVAPTLDPAFADWRAPAATLAATIDPARATLAACDPRPRTVRVVIDRRRGRTRAWLPAWQFHARSGDGTTPPRERAVKACLARAIRAWRLPLLPRTMGELHVAIPSAP